MKTSDSRMGWEIAKDVIAYVLDKETDTDDFDTTKQDIRKIVDRNVERRTRR